MCSAKAINYIHLVVGICHVHLHSYLVSIGIRRDQSNRYFTLWFCAPCWAEQMKISEEGGSNGNTGARRARSGSGDRRRTLQTVSPFPWLPMPMLVCSPPAVPRPGRACCLGRWWRRLSSPCSCQYPSSVSPWWGRTPDCWWSIQGCKHLWCWSSAVGFPWLLNWCPPDHRNGPFLWDPGQCPHWLHRYLRWWDRKPWMVLKIY